MTYTETLAWMFGQLPMYQRQGAFSYKIDLSKIVALAAHLHHPETQFRSVHVAGTNGKGSTSHMLASVLQEAGYTVGLYTSPHLKDFRERIRINGVPVSQDFVMDFIAKNRSYFESHALSFFEMTVGMAFYYFAKQEVDIAIIEVGLGGRLDATNIITPEVSVITNIGIDHTRFLGDTLMAIAKEKGGIIKPGVPVVLGSTHPETKPVFDAIVKEQNSLSYEVSLYKGPLYPSDLKGNYQQENIKTVLQTLSVLRDRGWVVDEAHSVAGLQNVVKNTGLLGRWQTLQEATPKVICDTGHNLEGLQWIVQQLLEECYGKLHLVLGVVDDKDLDRILPIFPKTARYYFTQANMPRALDAMILKAKANGYDLVGDAFPSVISAYQMALQNAENEDLVFVGGSTFVVAEVV